MVAHALIAASGRLRQENHLMFQASLVYTGKFKASLHYTQNLAFKTKLKVLSALATLLLRYVSKGNEISMLKWNLYPFS